MWLLLVSLPWWWPTHADRKGNFHYLVNVSLRPCSCRSISSGGGTSHRASNDWESMTCSVNTTAVVRKGLRETSTSRSSAERINRLPAPRLGLEDCHRRHEPTVIISERLIGAGSQQQHARQLWEVTSDATALTVRRRNSFSVLVSQDAL